MGFITRLPVNKRNNQVLGFRLFQWVSSPDSLSTVPTDDDDVLAVSMGFITRLPVNLSSIVLAGEMGFQWVSSPDSLSTLPLKFSLYFSNLYKAY